VCALFPVQGGMWTGNGLSLGVFVIFANSKRGFCVANLLLGNQYLLLMKCLYVFRLVFSKSLCWCFCCFYKWRYL